VPISTVRMIESPVPKMTAPERPGSDRLCYGRALPIIRAGRSGWDSRPDRKA
jgi:hypothetical protein